MKKIQRKRNVPEQKPEQRILASHTAHPAHQQACKMLPVPLWFPFPQAHITFVLVPFPHPLRLPLPPTPTPTSTPTAIPTATPTPTPTGIRQQSSRLIDFRWSNRPRSHSFILYLFVFVWDLIRDGDPSISRCRNSWRVCVFLFPDLDKLPQLDIQQLACMFFRLITGSG